MCLFKFVFYPITFEYQVKNPILILAEALDLEATRKANCAKK